ncbi:3-oxo-5-alpha-steroid 4-dehydrogenase 1 [Hypsibius exemplaris]|uniref:3-oxo-5alpha-steroid 4-dehydrogenase (NADP(+)) n=1 Tax=Hypsibius exemplaris TaxID=2072580 RepID=A0A1W0WUW3_HYPEX|nr:3-oxo-5-alpha-steroid 4-dehydrogenase 1 [Hypsibius exemplaris]
MEPLLKNFRNLSIPVLWSILGTSQEKQLLDLMGFAMIATAIVVYLALSFFPAPYGRYSTAAAGPQIDSKLAWIVQEAPSLIIPILVYFLMDNGRPTFEGKILIGLFVLHYLQRTVIYGSLIRGGKTTSLSTAALAFVFTAYNGYMQSRSLLQFRKLGEGYTTVNHPFFIAGVAIFVIGMAINIHSDSVLRGLRADGSPGYKIPRGGMFDFVSAANYFGEIVEWTGFAIAAGQLQGLAFFIFTLANLVPRAMTHHDWYLQKFRSEYPLGRTAILPFLI